MTNRSLIFHQVGFLVYIRNLHTDRDQRAGVLHLPPRRRASSPDAGLVVDAVPGELGSFELWSGGHHCIDLGPDR